MGVREEVREKWNKKREVISLLSDDEDLVEIVPKKKPKMDVFPIFKPLHNPSYDKHKLSNSLTINDLIGDSNLSKSYLFSFQYSMPFIFANLYSKKTLVTMVYQEGTIIDSINKTEYNINLIPVQMKPFSCHHPKVIINFYDNDEYIKIYLLSANLTEFEFTFNNQIVWESPKLIKKDSIDNDFKSNLIEFIKTYNKPELNFTLIKFLKNYDFNPIIGDFIYSSSGNFKNNGYLSLYNSLKKNHLLPSNPNEKAQLLYQTSSLGAPFANSNKVGPSNMLTNLLFPLSIGKKFPLYGTEQVRTLQKETNVQLFLIYPTLQDVRNSNFGYDSGGWSHYNPLSKNGKAQHDELLHDILYKSYSTQRKTNPSHTKFLIYSKDEFKSIEWVLFTSCNLSKSAWGNVKLDLSSVNGMNFESGILISRKHFKNGIKLIPTTIGENKFLKQDEIAIELPFKLPPEKYSPTDEPWIFSKEHLEPDLKGQIHQP